MSFYFFLITVTLAAPLVATTIDGLHWWMHHPQSTSTPWIGRVTTLLSLTSLCGSLGLALYRQDELQLFALVLGPFDFSLHIDALSLYFLLLVNLVAFIAAWYIEPFLAHDTPTNPKAAPTIFHALFNFFHFTMLLVSVLDNLVWLWVSVELTTLASALLVRYRRNQPALEAAWKYTIITTTGIIFALLGTLFLASAIPANILSEPNAMNWSRLIESANTEFTGQGQIIKLAFVFVLVGYGTKAGLAPMHTWVPDGHGEAPSPVSALLSGVLLKSALYAILRFYTLTNLALDDNARFTSTLLLGSGLFSLGLATPFILKPNKFKRILAYHSLEHMGIITFGVGVGSHLAIFGALLHALNHALTKALMFLAFGNAQVEYGSHGVMEENGPRGIFRALPQHGTLLALGGLALVGSPPFSIFLSEFIILWAALQTAGPERPLRTIAIGIFLMTVTLIFGGLVVHLARVVLGSPPFESRRESLVRLWPLWVLLVAILIFGFFIPSQPIGFPRLLDQSACVVVPQQCH